MSTGRLPMELTLLLASWLTLVMLLKSQLAAGLSCLWEGVEGTASEERGVARAGIGKAEQGVAAAETFYGFEM